MNEYLLTILGSDIDYFYEVESFLGPSDACIAKPISTKVGGCILNCSAVVASKNVKVKALDYLKENDDSTNLLIKKLNECNVDTSNIMFGKDVTNGSCLIMKKDDEKAIYVIDPKHPFYPMNSQINDLLNNASYIYTLPRVLKNSFEDIHFLKKIKANGVKYIFDGSSQYNDLAEVAILCELADGIFLNKNSYNKLCEVMKKEMIKVLLDKGCQFICVTDGENGSDLYYEDQKIHCKAMKVEVVDSTGAGDSFAGSFIASLMKGYDYQKTLLLATFNGAYACCKQGGLAGAVDDNTLLEFVSKNS